MFAACVCVFVCMHLSPRCFELRFLLFEKEEEGEEPFIIIMCFLACLSVMLEPWIRNCGQQWLLSDASEGEGWPRARPLGPLLRRQYPVPEPAPR